MYRAAMDVVSIGARGWAYGLALLTVVAVSWAASRRLPAARQAAFLIVSVLVVGAAVVVAWLLFGSNEQVMCCPSL